jgi:hypothetical protein
MNTIKLLWQKLAPQSVQSLIQLYTDTDSNKARRKKLIQNYRPANLQQPEIKEAIRYLKTHRFSPLPFFWTLKYDNYTTEVFFDSKVSFRYIIFEGKRLYFPKHYTDFQVLWTMRGILKEQDENSPHLYLTPDFQLENDSILIDGGVAEGSFSLSVIEKVKKLYLIECQQEWIEALRLTFAPWKDKVEFIGKYLSDSDTEQTISVDNFLKVDENENYFVKFDIEGYEKQAFEGMKSFFQKAKKLKMCVCTYHHQNDADAIGKILTEKRLKCKLSDGYIVFVGENENPTFRKALIRAEL